MLDAFLQAFPPTATQPIPAEQLAHLAATAPPLLGQLWRAHGLGCYGNGLLQLIDPERFRPVLSEWLGGERPTYTPFALGAFGLLYYHRQLTPTDEDVCCLDPHYRSISSCTWNLTEFFNNYLPDPEVRQHQLREPLFEAARAAHELLPAGAMYCFTPALTLGGAESAGSLTVGDAAVHLHLLYQLGL